MSRLDRAAWQLAVLIDPAAAGSLIDEVVGLAGGAGTLGQTSGARWRWLAAELHARTAVRSPTQDDAWIVRARTTDRQREVLALTLGGHRAPETAALLDLDVQRVHRELRAALAALERARAFHVERPVP